MDPDDNDIFLTPAARLCELAEILAAGILRLHVCEALVGDSEEGPPTKNLPLRFLRKPCSVSTHG